MEIESPMKPTGQYEKKKRLDLLHKEAQSYAQLRENIFGQMLEEKRKNKYKWFLRGMSVLRHLTDTKEQAGVIENFYVAMRYIDDIVDGDVKLPNGYKNPAEYIEAKIKFVESGGDKKNAKDEIEELLSLVFRLGSEFGHNYHKETMDILNCLLFDAKRKGTHETFDEATLHNHFYILDIRGSIKGVLKVVGENPNLYETIEPLGEAVRIYYNLRDFRDDIKAGLVNISSEDCARLNITKEELKGGYYENHPGVYTWFKEQAEKGLKLIEEYHKRRGSVNLRPTTKATLKLGFEAKAKMFLTAVAAGKYEKILGETI